MILLIGIVGSSSIRDCVAKFFVVQANAPLVYSPPSATAEFDESVISMPRLEKNAGAEAITGMPLDPADFKEEAGNPLTAVLVVKVIVRVGFKTRQVAALRNQGGRICR